MILKNKTALITGASGVIGGTIAEKFAKEGCNLMLSCRTEKKLEKLQEKLSRFGGMVKICPADVSSPGDITALIETTRKNFGVIHVLVTAAAFYGEIDSLKQCDPLRWLDAIKVNLWGTMLCVKHALPLFEKNKKGKIITFAGGGEGPLPNFSSYASSKGGILRFVESVSKELEPLNIEINAISPGLVNSGFVRDIIKAGPEKAGKEKYNESLKQLSGGVETASPKKAAELVVFLASEKSDGLTGRNISAIWDNFQEIPKHLEEINKSDIYTWRRIRPKDRGYDW
jgi:NAD(P)-dependent dehydrogenase (short-subunit alcohol dehydrogenase family)